MTKALKKAIFPVGGLGTRFLPATKSMPKEMLPIASKPLIQYAFEEAVAAGIEQFIFVTGRNKNAISNHFDHSYELQNVLSEKEKTEALALTKDWLPPAGQIAFLRQQQPLGLGHAVWCARNFIHDDEPFAVLLADEMFLSSTPLLKQMAEQHAKTGGNVVAVAEIPRDKTDSYGIIDIEEEKDNLVSIKGMVEKPAPDAAPSTTSIVGRYILNPDIFQYLGQKQKGSGGEIQLTDAMNHTLANGSPYYGLRFEGKRFDCGSRIGFLEANIEFALERDDMRDNVLKLLEKYKNLTAGDLAA